MKRNKLLLVASGLLILSGLALGACKAKKWWKTKSTR